MGELLSYFTDRHIAPESPYVWAGIGVSSAFLLVGSLIPLILWMTRRKLRKQTLRKAHVYRSFAGIMRTIGFVELVVYFLRYQSIFPFTNRTWVWGVALAGVIWAGYLWNKYRKIVPHYQKEDILHDRYVKYLPKPKRRSA